MSISLIVSIQLQWIDISHIPYVISSKGRNHYKSVKNYAFAADRPRVT